MSQMSTSRRVSDKKNKVYFVDLQYAFIYSHVAQSRCVVMTLPDNKRRAVPLTTCELITAMCFFHHIGDLTQTQTVSINSIRGAYKAITI